MATLELPEALTDDLDLETFNENLQANIEYIVASLGADGVSNSILDHRNFSAYAGFRWRQFSTHTMTDDQVSKRADLKGITGSRFQRQLDLADKCGDAFLKFRHVAEDVRWVRRETKNLCEVTGYTTLLVPNGSSESHRTVSWAAAGDADYAALAAWTNPRTLHRISLSKADSVEWAITSGDLLMANISWRTPTNTGFDVYINRFRKSGGVWAADTTGDTTYKFWFAAQFKHT